MKRAAWLFQQTRFGVSPLQGATLALSVVALLYSLVAAIWNHGFWRGVEACRVAW